VTTGLEPGCRRVLIAALATLDGEQGPLSSEQTEAHLETCAHCRESLARMKAEHARLGTLAYDSAEIDLWPNIYSRILHESQPHPKEGLAFALIAVLCLVWRTGQLVFDLPAPVLNGLVPLVTAVLVLHRLAGDPLAINLSTPELQQERM
jgi:anti-sigma factor RsiW